MNSIRWFQISLLLTKFIIFVQYPVLAFEINNQNIHDISEVNLNFKVALQPVIRDFDSQTKVADLDETDQKYEAADVNFQQSSKISPILPDGDLNSLYEFSVSEIANKQQLPTPKPINDFPLVVELDERPLIETPQEVESEDPNYAIPPRIAPKERINPLTTALPLNGIPISHLTEWEIIGLTSFGDDQNETLDYNAILKIYSQIEESLTRDNIFTVEQTGSYIQLQTVRTFREVTTLRKDPQTLFGTQIQMSLVGSCIFPDTPSDQQCTYTPGLVTDRNSIDPDFFVPTRINQTSNVGDIVTPESLAVMRLPGFQRGGNGQEIGLDLYFPNSGALPGNSIGDTPFFTREENNRNTPTGFYSTVRQVVRANSDKAVIGRTIRGYGLILNDPNFGLNSILKLGNTLLPDANPKITGGGNSVNPNINRNLFLAANNTRLPANSFAIYHAGIGEAKSPMNITNLNQVPNATFNSVWIGLSPVTFRSIESVNRYEIIGSQRRLASAGAEGGVNSNMNLLSSVNGQEFSTANLENFYTQIYLSNFEQDVNFVDGNRLIEKTIYHPHFSFTGNITGSQDVFKYYTGVITGDVIKAYLGGDFTRQTSDGWTYSAGAVGYINPDREDYSQLVGSVAKSIPVSRTTNFVLSTGVNYALDRETTIGRTISISPGSSVTTGVRLNMNSVYLGLVNYFGNILPNSIANTLLADLEIKFSNNFSLSAYYTPINETSSRSRYGTRAQLKLGNDYNSPSLSLSWNNNEYDFGRDANGNDFSITNNVFRILFKIGDPANPFDPQTAERLRRGVDQGIEQLQRERNFNQLEQINPQPAIP
ncbi:hypothetical protein [Nodularia sp. NIES-3585]|uniref:hypothetical protein n=1 Tax=Nodularia sp. NIES-3585 TaxID=1973477 RepID=UPI000B5C8403|nr:hypothetical protein [Nodularia sp. NIES-3585]GAX36129.1 hypothetical protein NIES3585_21550 [Nodularia sp. NIES-3585]